MKPSDHALNSLSRREALKTLGTGAALLSLGLIAPPAKAADAPAAQPAAPEPAAPAPDASPSSYPFSLPPLGYAFDALEPHIDARTMEIHYTKHHQGYVTNANRLIADAPQYKSLPAEEILRGLTKVPRKYRDLYNNLGGHVNHMLFWRVIGPQENKAPGPELFHAINRTFGSFETFKTKFADAAFKRFGSGWAWLSLKGGSLTITTTANQDSPLSEGLTPLLGVDVWEHAYYLHYQNRRIDYLTAFWNVVNWRAVDANYAAAVK